ncbi:MAG TPA: cation diffusion facilitator family transporter, partial [Salinimicrobium sp.]|nr:cation diffusion facilitator family transporter [Salinimicrobium sp.]
MATGGSNIAIYGAIIANILIAIGKFLGAFFTGSSAMMAEGIHSLVDTGNGLLLLFGIKRSHQKPDKLHPFGHGKEIYFWSFVVSMLIFAVGGGFAIYEGIHALQEPEVIEDPTWSYVVLFAAIIFEGSALYVALKTFNKSRRESVGLFKSIVHSKDAATFAVIIEDTAALTGLVIALTGIFLSQTLDNPYFDGGASILIGLLLLGVSTFLARESRDLLLGESADDRVIAEVEEILKANPNVEKWGNPNSMHFGPDQ